jgi:CMP-N-acetylneuraminic acid synthetase
VLDNGYLFDGRVGTVLIPAERSLDIDTPFDLLLAELLLSRS